MILPTAHRGFGLRHLVIDQRLVFPIEAMTFVRYPITDNHRDAELVAFIKHGADLAPCTPGATGVATARGEQRLRRIATSSFHRPWLAVAQQLPGVTGLRQRHRDGGIGSHGIPL